MIEIFHCTIDGDNPKRKLIVVAVTVTAIRDLIQLIYPKKLNLDS